MARHFSGAQLGQTTNASSSSVQHASHVDSEEVVRHERRRVAQEMNSCRSSNTSYFTAENHSRASLSASLQRLTASQESLQRSSSCTTEPNTEQDVPTVDEVANQRTIFPANTPSWYRPIAKFWSTHITITIDDGAHRDHLALERTFLGYLRTSLVFVMIGVLIAQLFRLQRVSSPNLTFGFFVIGQPLSTAFIGAGLLTVLVGAFRFWKLQQGLMRGKAHSGGWEVLLIMCLSFLLMLATFALIVGIDIEKTYFGS